MKTKILSLFTLSIFLVAIFGAFASAAIVLTPATYSATVNQGGSTSFTFDLSADYPSTESNLTNLSVTSISNLVSGTNTIDSSNVVVASIPSTLAAGSNVSNIGVLITVPSNQATGTYIGTITIDADRANSSDPNPQSQTIALSITVTAPTSTSSTLHFCNNGLGPVDNSSNITDINNYPGDLLLNVDVNDKGEGDDDAWLPLDEVQVKVELENNRDADVSGTDLRDVYYVVGLFKVGQDTNSKNYMKDMIWISSDDEKHKVGSINADKSKTYTFDFRVDPHNLDSGDYRLYVKAYESGKEDQNCIDFSDDLTDFGTSKAYASITIDKESDSSKMVVVDTSSYPEQINALCGAPASLSADVYNIGDQDFNDQIKVTLQNSELGINQQQVIEGDFNEGDKSTATFNFNVPKDAKPKLYNLGMRTFYDYDSDTGVYNEVSDKTFYAYLNVSGNCMVVVPTTVTANLLSGGKAGEDLVVKATVTNNGASTSTYVVNPAGYSTWASAARTDVTTFSLSPGQSRDVMITLPVNKDVSGTNTFNIEVLSGNELAVSQPVSVNIEKAGFLTGAVVGASGLAWGFGVLSIILIVAIIVVLLRLRK